MVEGAAVEKGGVLKKVKGSHKSSRFKSHDWQVVAETDLGGWLFSFLLKGVQLQTVLRVLRIFRLVCRRSLSPAQRAGLVGEVREALLAVRVHLPRTEWGALLHDLLHIAEQCCRWGPVWTRWMYGFERLNGHLVSLIQDRAKPEDSIAKVLTRLMFHRASTAGSFGNLAAEGADPVDLAQHAATFARLVPARNAPPTEEHWRGGKDVKLARGSTFTHIERILGFRIKSQATVFDNKQLRTLAGVTRSALPVKPGHWSAKDAQQKVFTHAHCLLEPSAMGPYERPQLAKTSGSSVAGTIVQFTRVQKADDGSYHVVVKVAVYSPPLPPLPPRDPSNQLLAVDRTNSVMCYFRPQSLGLPVALGRGVPGFACADRYRYWSVLRVNNP